MRALLVAFVITAGCGGPSAHSEASSSSAAPLDEPAPLHGAPAQLAPRTPIDGRAFPDKVLALTWDDGPDVRTLELAEYLQHRKIAATFFLVDEWLEDVSDEPGAGSELFDTGNEHLPIAGDLTALGHRLGNHTLNHVVLRNVGPTTVDFQLRENQSRLDPFITNELALFRAPGGAWNAEASEVVDSDPDLKRLVGPVAWDIDRKDWEGSLYCRSSRPAVECERAAPDGGLRVKPSVIARRYLASIDAVGHGIVLFHDRVGHVGSDYALQVAHRLIPALEARGYVFAAPVLQFSPPRVRPWNFLDKQGHGGGSHPRLGKVHASGVDLGDADATILLGDLNGDGRADLCGRTHEGVLCALATGRSFTRATMWLKARPADRDGWLSPTHAESLTLGDVNGDGRADLCGRGPEGIVCAFAP